jgi:hypothetical protein
MAEKPQAHPFGDSDILGVKKSGTESRMTEVHALSHEKFYDAFQFQRPTPLHPTDGTWDFVVLDTDLVGIKKSGTESGTTELHFLRGDKDYQEFGLQTPTALHLTDQTWAFAVLDRDIFCIEKSGTQSGTTEIHILDSSKGYQSFRAEFGTCLHETGPD